MNRADAVALAQLVRAARPQQTWNEHTPDAWALSLRDINCEDARAVLPDLLANSKWVTPLEIRDAVGSLRGRRLDTYGERIPPPPDPDDVLGYITWEKEWRRAVADGQVPPERPSAPVTPLPPLAQLLPSMPEPTSPTGRRGVSRANPALSRACSWCQAPAGKRCTTASGPVTWVHDARTTPPAESPSQEQHT